MNCSSDVNVVYEGSPSRIFKVLLISLGITILPQSSTQRTIPVAVPCVRLGDGAPALHTDRSFSVGTPLLRCPRTPEDGCPYNNFTNYAVSICKRQEIIPLKTKKQTYLCSIEKVGLSFLKFFAGNQIIDGYIIIFRHRNQ